MDRRPVDSLGVTHKDTGLKPISTLELNIAALQYAKGVRAGRKEPDGPAGLPKIVKGTGPPRPVQAPKGRPKPANPSSSQGRPIIPC